MSEERPPLYGIRYKDGERESFSILAEAELSTEGSSPDSRIHQTITATIAVGAFDRRTLFLTHDFELVGSLVLYGRGTDFDETFYIPSFAEAFSCKSAWPDSRDIEVFDMLSGESVDVRIDDPRLADVVRCMSAQD